MFSTILNYNGGCRVMLSQSKNACWQELVEMYTGMKRFGPPLVASTFNTLLNGMLLLGDLKHAIFIVEEMYRNHFVPSFTSLSKTLKMAVKVGNLLDGLLVFELMLSGRGKVLAFGSTDFFPSRASHAKHLQCRIFEKNPTKIKNYGIWLRYQSRIGYHNMYKEYRDTTLNGVVEQKYTEIASHHRVRFPCIHIIKTATIPAKLCKRDSTKQLHNSKIKFLLVFNKVRPPTKKLKTTYKASKPNLFKFSHCNKKRFNMVYSSKIFDSEHLSVY